MLSRRNRSETALAITAVVGFIGAIGILVDYTIPAVYHYRGVLPDALTFRNASAERLRGIEAADRFDEKRRIMQETQAADRYRFGASTVRAGR